MDKTLSISITAVFGVCVSIAGFILKEYAESFDKWVTAIEEAKYSQYTLTKDVNIIKNDIANMRKSLYALQSKQYPPQKTRDRIESIEDFLIKDGYLKPHKEWIDR